MHWFVCTMPLPYELLMTWPLSHLKQRRLSFSIVTTTSRSSLAPQRVLQSMFSAGSLDQASSTASKAVNGAWNNFRSQTGLFVNPEDPVELKEESAMDEFSEMTSLTRMQRIYGFFMALGMGIAFFLLAISFLPTIALFPKKFAFFFTCGNVFCVASSVFIVGFRRQLETMMEAHRFQAASVYLVSMFMTLAAALHWQSSVLALIFACIQLAAVLWYSLSYVPYARHTLSFVWGYLLIILKPLLAMLGSLLWKLTQCVCGSK